MTNALRANSGAGGGTPRWLRSAVPDDAKPWLRYAAARAKEAVGIDHFPARFGLERRLLAQLGRRRGGVFVEAGAYDGITQSNSWHLERRLGWRGLLVEPLPRAATLCRRFRPGSIVECCALGSFDQEGTVLTLHDGGLMTVAEGAEPRRMAGGSAASHAAVGTGGAPRGTFQSPVAALSTLLDRHGIGQVDLLSLDVEGYEAHALDGIDFDRHAIGHILVETVDPAAIEARIGARYARVAKFSRVDFLYARREPADG